MSMSTLEEICSPKKYHLLDRTNPQPQEEEYNYEYGEYGDYGDGESYYDGEDDSAPDEDNYGYPSPDDTSPDADAARYGGRNRYDPCANVHCPELDCPTTPYIPQGECCPVCPGGSRSSGLRPGLQVCCMMLTPFYGS